MGQSEGEWEGWDTEGALEGWEMEGALEGERVSKGAVGLSVGFSDGKHDGFEFVGFSWLIGKKFMKSEIIAIKKKKIWSLILG